MSDSDSLPHEYRIDVHDDPHAIDASAWDALLGTQASPTPFMRHAYLAALHDSCSAVPDTGWAPRFVTVHHDGRLVAATAAYLKTHSYGEYVFDWAWADAYRRAGLRYYPKLLGAVPFTPVPGSRLLACDDAARDLLVHALREMAIQMKLSSAHVLFVDDVDRAAFERAGWLMREGVQFHWTQDAATPLSSFDDLLARLQRDKRKKIAQERRRVAEAGVSFSVHRAGEIDDALWDFFHHCYTRTYAAHHSTPYLTREFFAQVARTMPEHWLLFVAHRAGQRVAASLIVIDETWRAAYGRYWGCTEFVPCLHFEACYYQPLAWC